MLNNALRRLRKITRALTSRAVPQPRRRWRTLPLVLEPLEERTLMTANAFINPSGGSWEDPANWSAGAVPGPGDDVVIDLSGNVTVSLS